MKGLIHNFDNPNQSFWEVAGNLDMVPAFSVFKKADKTKGKEHSSRVMWAIAIFCDQSSGNRLRNLPSDDKKGIIENEILKVKKSFEWDKYKHLVSAYLETQLTETARSLFVLKAKLQERSEFLRKTEYTMDNARDLDSIIANSDKLFRLIISLEKTLDQEEKGGNELRGGLKKGLQELGKI